MLKGRESEHIADVKRSVFGFTLLIIKYIQEQYSNPNLIIRIWTKETETNHTTEAIEIIGIIKTTETTETTGITETTETTETIGTTETVETTVITEITVI